MLGEPVRTRVLVRADWETRGTFMLAGGAALVLIVGLVRTFRRGPRRRGRDPLRPGSTTSTPDPGTTPTTTTDQTGRHVTTPGQEEHVSEDEPVGDGGLLRSSAVMAAGTAVSRVLGFGRTIVLIAALGATTTAANTFDVANKIPNVLYMLLAGGVLNAVLVPQIVRASKAPDRGEDFVNRLVTLSLVLLAGVTVLLTAAAPLLVLLYAPTQRDDWLWLATAFAFWCVPQVFFYGLYTVLGQVLNARGRFGAYMWAPVLNNVVAIVCLLAFLGLYGTGKDGQHAIADWSPGMIALVAGSATLGVTTQALVLIWPLRRAGFRFTPAWGFRGVGLGSARRVAGWTFAAVLVGQLGLLVTTIVATTAEERVRGTAEAAGTPGIATYSYAFLLFMLPHSLVAVSLVTALFTRMSRAAGDDDWATVRDDLSLGLRTVGVFSVLATIGLVVLSTPVGIAMVGDEVQGRALGSVVAAMSLGLTAFSATYLFQRVYYAYEDARSPFLVQVPTIAVVVVADVLSLLLLPPRFVVVGVGAGMSLSALVSVGLAAWWLRRTHGDLDGARVVRTHVRLVTAGALTAVAGVLVVVAMRDVTESGRLGALLTCAAGGAAMATVYLVGLRLLHVRELRFLTDRLGRVGRLIGG